MPSIDRSREFLSTVQTIQSKYPLQILPSASPKHHYSSSSSPGSPSQRGGPQNYSASEFTSRVTHLTGDIVKMGEALEKLSQIAKSMYLNDDKQYEIQQLTQLIKIEITSINDQFKQLQSLQKNRSNQLYTNAAGEEHSNQVVKSLQMKFANMSSSFKEVLQQRSQNMINTKQRRELYGKQESYVPSTISSILPSTVNKPAPLSSRQASPPSSDVPGGKVSSQTPSNISSMSASNAPRNISSTSRYPSSPYFQSSQQQPSTLSTSSSSSGAAPIGSTTSSFSLSRQERMIPMNPPSNTVSYRSNTMMMSTPSSGDNVTLNMETNPLLGSGEQQSQQQQSLLYAPSTSSTESYYQSRNTAIESIESAITELGYIFSQLAHMVAAQGETVQRIDTDIEESHGHVERGQQELLRYWRSISSNRQLLMISFGILIFFFVIFSILFA